MVISSALAGCGVIFRPAAVQAASKADRVSARQAQGDLAGAVRLLRRAAWGCNSELQEKHRFEGLPLNSMAQSCGLRFLVQICVNRQHSRWEGSFNENILRCGINFQCWCVEDVRRQFKT